MYKTKKMSTNFISKVAVLGAISGILSLFHISVWFAPSFYKIDIADAIILIGGYALGPVSVIYMQIVKILINLLIDSTTTFLIGEFANFSTGLVFVLVSTIIYHKKKNYMYTIIGTIIGLIAVCLFSSILNVYVTIPIYSKAFDMPIDEIISFASLVNPKINDMSDLVLFAIIPFNIMKYTINTLVANVLYKRLSNVLKLNYN